MELIMKAASSSSRTPPREKPAAMGMVPYMHSGEHMPSSAAGTMASVPARDAPSRSKAAFILPLAKTLTAEPISMPSTHQRAICSSWTMK